MSVAPVQARGVSKAFGALQALSSSDIAVARGEIVVLVGPSGCGKSTLLSLLAGLAAPDTGAVTPSERPPGVVFQEPTLMGWASARDNVALPLVLGGLKEAEARRLADAALAETGLAGFEGARSAALSGGMRMRCALARALVTGPDALLLDEPFAAIDELGRRALDDLVLSVRDRMGLAVLFVTHSVDEAACLADRILVMAPRPGRIIAEIPVRGDGVRTSAFMTTEAFARACADTRLALSGVAA